MAPSQLFFSPIHRRMLDIIFVVASQSMLLSACGGGGGGVGAYASDALAQGLSDSEVVSEPGAAKILSIAATVPDATSSTAPIWTKVAIEGGALQFTGARAIRYGIDNAWTVQLAPGGSTCSNATFGDPVPGRAKECDVLAAASASTGDWTRVAVESGSFTLAGTQAVRYGTGTQWVTLNMTGPVACGNATFGDPASGMAKECQILGASGSWAQIAKENDQFSVSGSKLVRYGTGSKWIQQVVSGTVTCGNSKFGDPAVGYLKECDVLSLPTSASSQPAMAGVFVGNSTADLARYEKWLGKPADAVLAFTGQASWTDYDGSIGWAAGLWAATDRRILWSIPLIPTGANLGDAAAGRYDSHYTLAAQQLVKFRPQDPKIYIRTGWEFNANWFPWTAIGQPQNYVAAYQRFVNAFRAVAVANGTPDRFIFEWNVNIGDGGMNPETAYPGDAYVDIVGMDAYWFSRPQWNATTQRWEQWDPADPTDAWNKQLTRSWGLNWQKTFAAAHGKKLAISEWGIESDTAAPYVKNMLAWIAANNMVYQTYWDSSSVYPGSLSDNSNPSAGAAYIGGLK